ncbi:MAG: hypothetical protein SGARI_003922 [Bacillariaceae sp.]
MMEERKKFYDAVLRQHEGKEGMAWVISIICRKKYDPTLTTGSSSALAREILRARDMTKEKFLQRIDLAEFKAAQWRDAKTGEPAPRKAWVCYISANALDTTNAFFAYKKELDQHVTDIATAAVNGRDVNNGRNHAKPMEYPESLYRSCLEKSPRRDYFKLDVDTKDAKLLAELAKII